MTKSKAPPCVHGRERHTWRRKPGFDFCEFCLSRRYFNGGVFVYKPTREEVVKGLPEQERFTF